MDKQRLRILFAIFIVIIIYYIYYKNISDFKGLAHVIFFINLNKYVNTSSDKSSNDIKSNIESNNNQLLVKYNLNNFSKFLFSGYDAYKYPFWTSEQNSHIKIIFISTDLLNSFSFDKSLIWSWIIYDDSTLDIIFYSHTKCSMTPYDNNIVWDDNMVIIKT